MSFSFTTRRRQAERAGALQLESWNRQRTREELRSFLDLRESACDVADFDF